MENEQEQAPEIIEDPRHNGILVTRSIVHNKRVAPAGCVFFVAKCNRKMRNYLMAQLVYTQGVTNEQENEFKTVLKEKLLDFMRKN